MNRGERRRAERAEREEQDSEAAQRAREAEHLALAADLPWRYILPGKLTKRILYANRLEDLAPNRETDDTEKPADSACRANTNGPTFKNDIKIPNNYYNNEAVNDPKYGHKRREAIHVELRIITT